MTQPTDTALTPPIKKLSVSAPELVAMQARRRRSRVAGNYIIDIEGGLSAGQIGVAIEAAHRALFFSLQAFLLDQGFALVPPEHTLKALVAADSSGNLAAEAWVLVATAPQTVYEARAYCERCQDFIRRRLGIRAPRFEEGNYDEASSSGFWQILEQVEQVADHVGVKSPFPSSDRPRNLTA